MNWLGSRATHELNYAETRIGVWPAHALPSNYGMRRWFPRGGVPGQADTRSGSLRDVQQEVPGESEHQPRLPGSVPAVAVPARRHARLLPGPALRGQEGNYAPETGLCGDTSREGAGWPGGGAATAARKHASGLWQKPRWRGSWGKK